MSSPHSLSLPPRVVRASAGSGKTYQLSSRFLQLVLLGEDPDKILATTFTKKAAGEIRDRIFHRLVEGAKSDKAARALGVDLGLPTISLSDVRGALKRCVSLQHRLNICTLDSFFTNLAKAFTSELKLAPQWRLFEEHETKAFLDDAVTEICRQGNGIIELLRLVQRGDGGRRIHEMLVRQVSELRSIVYATDKTAWDFQLEAAAPTKSALQDAIRAFSEIPAPLNKSKSPFAAFVKAQKKITELMMSGPHWEEKLLIEGGKLVTALISRLPSYSQAPLSEEMYATFEPIKEQLRSTVFSQIKNQTKALRELTEQIVSLYEQHRTASAAVSFDDVKRLIFEAAIVQNLPEIFFRIDTKIKHVLLDEFQDTSLDEWRLIEPIADEILSHSDGSHTFFCVGDTKQSIYGFRGGVAEIFDTLESRWQHLQSDRMEISRRSSPVVLDFVNQIFSTIDTNEALSSYAEAGQIWKKRFEPHEAFQKSQPGFVSVVSTPSDSDESSPIAMCADEIAKLHSAYPTLSIGVLVREQKAIASCLYELSKRGVAASGEGGSSLLDSPVVSAVISFLWFVDHPGDSISHYHVARSPLATALDIQESDSLERRDRVAVAFREQVISKGLREVLSALAQKIEPLCSKRDRNRMHQLIEASIPYSIDKTVRLSGFVEHIQNFKVLDPDQSAVRVMTIHKSKGLEFDAVFLCNLDVDLIRPSKGIVSCTRENPLESPSRVTVAVKSELRALDPLLELPYTLDKTNQVVDALSVLYVALTRARFGLYLFVDLDKGRKSIGKVIGAALSRESDSEEAEGPKAVFSDGDAQWPSQILVPQIKETPKEVVSLNVTFNLSQTTGARHLTRITPSRHDTGTLFSVVSDRALAARSKGTLLHALCERVEWIESLPKDKELENALIHAASSERLSSDTSFKEVIGEFHTMLGKGEIRSVFTPETYRNWKVESLRVVNERRFSVLTKGGLSVGTIDRLVLGITKGKVTTAEIVDFKTDFNSDKNFASHASQIAYYREAISTIYSLPETAVTGKLVYLETGEVKAV